MVGDLEHTPLFEHSDRDSRQPSKSDQPAPDLTISSVCHWYPYSHLLSLDHLQANIIGFHQLRTAPQKRQLLHQHHQLARHLHQHPTRQINYNTSQSRLQPPHDQTRHLWIVLPSKICHARDICMSGRYFYLGHWYFQRFWCRWKEQQIDSLIAN